LYTVDCIINFVLFVLGTASKSLLNP